MRLSELERARIMLEMMKIANPETTIADMELCITSIERILIEEGTIKVPKKKEIRTATE